MKKSVFSISVLLLFFSQMVGLAADIRGPVYICPGTTQNYRFTSDISAPARVKWEISGNAATMLNPITGATSRTVMNVYDTQDNQGNWMGRTNLGIIIDFDENVLRTVTLKMTIYARLNPFGFKDEITIQIGPDLSNTYVTGDRIISSCGKPDMRYTVQRLPNAPDGTTPEIIWTHSNNLRIVSGRNSKTVKVESVSGSSSGSGFVRPNFNYNGCVTQQLRLAQYSVTLYNTAPPKTLISGPSQVNSGGTVSYSCPAPGAKNFTWTYPSGWQCVGGCNDSYINLIPSSNSGDVSCFYSNTCGSNSTAKEVTVTGGGGGGPIEFAVFPNPTDEQLTVEQINTKEGSSIVVTSSKESTTEKDHFKVELYNNYQKKVAKAESHQGKVELNIKKLPTGTYYLHIYHKSEIFKEQIMVE